jgi:hypothetical protein
MRAGMLRARQRAHAQQRRGQRVVEPARLKRPVEPRRRVDLVIMDDAGVEAAEQEVL